MTLLPGTISSQVLTEARDGTLKGRPLERRTRNAPFRKGESPDGNGPEVAMRQPEAENHQP